MSQLQRKDRLQRLFGKVADGHIDDVQYDELKELLCNDPAAIDEYLSYMTLDAELSWEFGHVCDRDVEALITLNPITATEVNATEVNASKIAGKSSSGSRSPVGVGTRLAETIDWRTHPVQFGVFTLMLTLLLWMSFLRPWEDQKTATPGARNFVVPEFVAGVTDTHKVVWADSRTALWKGLSLAVGNRVELKSGLIEITFRNGAVVVVQGPAEFEVRGRSSGILRSGRLSGWVEEPATGLVVDTPHVRVNDLGTRFAVVVQREADVTETVVFQGEVEVVVRTADGFTGRRMRLLAGESVIASAGGLIPQVLTQSERDAYVQEMPVPQKPLIASVQANSGRKYRIVHLGLGEDVLSNTDRDYQWNGMTAEGMPKYLIGADYVMTPMDDNSNESLKVVIRAGRAITLCVFVNATGRTPAWVVEQFEPTGGVIGRDTSSVERDLGVGPGVSVERPYDIWEKHLAEGETVLLGPAQSHMMYGLAAVARDGETQE